MPTTKKTTQTRAAAAPAEDEVRPEPAPDDAPTVVEDVCQCEGSILVVGGNCTTCGKVVRA